MITDELDEMRLSDIDKLLKMMRTLPAPYARWVDVRDTEDHVIPYCPVEFP